MLMTIQQAKDAWCPMARIGVEGHGLSLNDPGSIKDYQGRCIGTQCAMWRWHDTRNTEARDDDARPGAILAPTVKMVPRGESRRGYCGLAGKPGAE